MAKQTVSFIVSVFNRTDLLRKNLTRLSLLTIPDEIVIVDDGSDNPEGLKDMLRGFTELDGNPTEFAGRIKYVRYENPHWDSCSIPKNIGLKHSTGDILIYSEPELIFIQDPIVMAREIFETVKDKYIRQEFVYFEKRGVQFPDSGINNPMKYLEEFGYYRWDPDGSQDVHGGDLTYTKARMVSPWTIIIRREHLIAINGWDENMSLRNGGGGWGFEEIDLISRLRESGVGEHEAKGLEVVHMFHERPPQHIQDSWRPNEALMKAKQDEEGAYLPETIKANQDKEWGVLDGYVEVF